MKMSRIEIPARFSPNSANVLAMGLEKTGAVILEAGNELLGCRDLGGKDVLDLGCGVRFTQTFINRDLPLGSYTGIDVDKPMIDYLAEHVQDSRFSFHYWNVHNELYHRNGKTLEKHFRLPLPRDRTFDLAWMYSVITHNNPWDSGCIFHILRKYIKKDGALLFSAFIDDGIKSFEDRLKDQPMVNAYYNRKFLEKIIGEAGWVVEKFSEKKPDSVMQNLFLCRPRRRFWSWWS